MMKISPIKASFAVNSESISDISKIWKVGQILNATTEHGGDALSKVLLRVGQYLLETRTPVALQDGQNLKLLVKIPLENKAGDLPVLKILTPLFSNSAVSGTGITQVVQGKTTVAVKLRQFIAAQQSFSQLQQLGQAILTNKLTDDLLPQSLKLWLNRIQDNLLITNKGISSSQLKQHILNSGIFLESKLRHQLRQPTTQINSQAPLSQDLKYQLLAANAELKQLNSAVVADKLSSQSLTPQQSEQLITQLKLTGNKPQQLADRLLAVLPKFSLTQLVSLLAGPGLQISVTDELRLLAQVLTQLTQPPAQLEQGRQSLLEQLQFRLMLLDLGHQVEQSINKLTSMQLQPLSREGDNLMLLLFNLVFKDNHQQFDVNFRIQQEDETSETAQESWQITLAFNFKTLGSVQSKIHLTDNQVSTVFYTELPTTADRIQTLLPLLETGLTDAGLQVNNLSIAKGPLEQEEVVDHNIHLLDETA